MQIQSRSVFVATSSNNFVRSVKVLHMSMEKYNMWKMLGKVICLTTLSYTWLVKNYHMIVLMAKTMAMLIMKVIRLRLMLTSIIFMTLTQWANSVVLRIWVKSQLRHIRKMNQIILITFCKWARVNDQWFILFWRA